MALPVQKLREAVFQLLYSMEFHEGIDGDLIEVVMQELKITKRNAESALSIAKKISEQKSTLDTLIKDAVESYELERIQSIERVLLRLALYECVITKEIPIEISISEAKRLVRKFGNREAEPFVQAVIDAIYKNSKEIRDNAPPVLEG